MSLPSYMTRTIFSRTDANAFIRALGADAIARTAAAAATNRRGSVFTREECAVIAKRHAEVLALATEA